MENIISKLLVADNATILQGTVELRNAFQSPDAIPALCNVLTTSSNPQVRQYAAVLLRKRLTKQRHWSKLTPDAQKSIKDGIIQVLINEKEKFIKNSVAQFVGTLAKHELPKSNWSELPQLIHHLLLSSNVEDRELALFTLSVLTDVAYDAFTKQPSQLTFLFQNNYVTEPFNVNLAFYSLITLLHVVPLVNDDSEFKNQYTNHIPYVVNALKHMVQVDTEKAAECMEIFDELLDLCPSVISPHINLIISFCLEVAVNKAFGGVMQCKAIVRQQLMKPIVNVLFDLMCLPTEEDFSYFAYDDDNTDPSVAATQTLDMLALHLPAEKLITEVLLRVSPGLESSDAHVKRGCYMSLAMLAEGCAECIRGKHLNAFLECVCKGITDSAPEVCNSALFALGQLSEHLQPEISEYAAVVLPILFQYLSQLSATETKDKTPPSVERMFYALEVFCENLEEGLLQYLPGLMEHLFLMLNSKHSLLVQEQSLRIVGAAAEAVKLEILPFFPKIIEHLKAYLVPSDDDSTVSLQVQAVDTLGVLARTLGKEHFAPLTQETMQLGLRLATEADDPDLRKASYGLFGALSYVLKEEFGLFLPKMVELMMTTLKSSNGIVAHYKDEEDAAFPVYDDLSDTPDEEDIEGASESSSDSDDVKYCVENAYMEEKGEACAALKDIAHNAGTAFVPYLQESFEVVVKLVAYPQDDIRKVSIETLAEFCVCFSKIDTPEGKQALDKSLFVVVPKASEIIRMDGETDVVMVALDALRTLLQDIGRPVLEGAGHKAAIMNCVTDVLTQKTVCQDPEEEGEHEQAEQDEMLLESAGEIIPPMVRALDSAELVQCFTQLLQLIIPKTRKKCSASQRAHFTGTLAECIGPFAPVLGPYCGELLQLFMPLVKDESHNVRNNAIYGLGELVLHGKDALYSHYNGILEVLSSTLSKETHAQTIDNICGAIARLIMTNTSLVPMDVVFPVFMSRLPLRDDMDEHVAVLKSFGHLYQMGHPVLLQHMTALNQVCATILFKRMGKDEVLTMATELLRLCQKEFSAEFTAAMQTVGPEVSSGIQPLLQQ